MTPTTLTLSDDGSRAALEEHPRRRAQPADHPDPDRARRQDAVTRFENGRLGMMIGTRDLVPRAAQPAGLDFDVYPLPSLGRSATVADVSGYCVSRTSAHIDEAADFVAFASSDAGSAITARVRCRRAGQPLDPALRRPSSSRAVPVNVDVFASVLRRADTMPNPPGWPDVVERPSR